MAPSKRALRSSAAKGDAAEYVNSSPNIKREVSAGYGYAFA